MKLGIKLVVEELLLIGEVTPSLSVQSDSIQAKVFARLSIINRTICDSVCYSFRKCFSESALIECLGALTAGQQIKKSVIMIQRNQ